MKINKSKYILFLTALLTVVFWGCLKDDAFDNGEIQSVHSDQKQNVVYIGLTATSNDNHLQLAFEKSDADTTFDAVPIVLS